MLLVVSGSLLKGLGLDRVRLRRLDVGAGMGRPPPPTRMRSLYPDWEGLARSVVSYIRMEAARKPDDPALAELVGDLSIRDPQFRQWWAGTHVALKRRGTRTYDHPVVGEITLDWDALASDAEPDQQVIIYTAEPGSPSEQALRNLAAW